MKSSKRKCFMTKKPVTSLVSMTLLRPLSAYERLFAETDEMVQFAVEVCHPRHLPAVVDILLKGISAFHLKTDGKSVFNNPTPVEIFEMPKSLKNACEAALWIDRERRPDLSKRLAAIGVSDTKVAVAVSHLLADGGFCSRMLERITSDVHEVAPFVPRPVEDVFARELADPALPVQEHVDGVGKLAAIPWSDDVEKGLPEDVRCMYFFQSLKVDELSCWDREKKRFNGLTENLWLAMTVSYAAFSGNQEKMGCSTCVDLRQLLKGKPDLSVGNCFSSISVIPKGFTKNMTLREIGELMRRDLVAKKNNGGFLASVKGGLGGYVVSPPREAFAELSNVGRMELKKPIVDVWVQQTMKSRGIEAIMPTLSFSTAGDCEHRIAVRTQYSPTVVSERVANVLFKSIVHLLKNMPLDAPFTAAFDEAQRYQKTLAANK